LSNLLVTMCLGGLWHGASWNFLFWGCLHGIFLGLEKIASKWKKAVFPEGSTLGKHRFWSFLGNFFKWGFVFFSIVLLWIPFRSQDWNTTKMLITKMLFLLPGQELARSLKNEFYFILVIVGLSHFLYLKFQARMETWLDLDLDFPKVLLFSICLILVVLLSKETQPFIYFVF
jgi:alginate O-acetyltransferase complex protein AlgI